MITVKIDEQTWDRLGQFIRPGQSFDDALNMLMDVTESVFRGIDDND